jgi:hypothetical protein
MARSNPPIYEDRIYVLIGNIAGESLKAGPRFIFSFRGGWILGGFDKNIYTELPATVHIKKLMPTPLRDRNPGGFAEYLDRLSFFGVHSYKVTRPFVLYEEVQGCDVRWDNTTGVIR